MDAPVMPSNPEDDDLKAPVNDDAPETPKNVSTQLPNVTSTPFNIGTASQAQHLTLGRLEDVEHYFRVDLDQRASNAKLDSFLIFLLSCGTGEDDRETLEAKLAQLLEVALTVCLAPPKAEGDPNESTPQVGPTLEGEGDKSHTERRHGHSAGAAVRPIWRDYLEKYAEASPEDKRYDPFVQLTNSILQALREPVPQAQLDITGIAPKTGSSSRIIFQRNDPKYVIETYTGNAGEELSAKVKRKPDVVVLSVHDAAKTHMKKSHSPHPSVPQNPDTLFSSHASQAPKIPVSGPPFSRVKMCFEFKKALGKDALKPLIPSTYAKKEKPEEIMPQTWKAADNPFKAAPGVKKSSQLTTHRSSVAYEQSKRSDPKKRPPLQGKDDQSSNSRKKHKKADGAAKRLPAEEPTPEDDTDKHSLDQNPSTKELPGPIQSAIYAGGKLSSSVFADHTLNAVVVDHVLWLWWYDHGSAIQSYGLDFFGDLPYFVALLAILDHFDDQSWDLHPAFTKTNVENNEVSAYNVTLRGNGPNQPDTPFRLGTTRSKHYSYYGLFGRGTSILDVTSSALNPLQQTTNLRDVNMVAKIYHPEETRVSEVDLLKTAYAVAADEETDPDSRVRGHLPLLVASRSWANRYSDKINTLLKLDTNKRQTRSLRILIFVKLYAIFELQNDDFLKAFADCMFCHWGLAKNRILHRDISVNNLMYYTTSTGQVMGVLIDFDLSIIEGFDRDEGLDRTGTVPYMAYRLLKAMVNDNRIPHIFEYDFESFYYVLVWITCRYTGSSINEAMFENWGTAKTFGDAADRKIWSVNHSARLEFTQSHPNAGTFARGMAKQIMGCRFEQDGQDYRRNLAELDVTTWNIHKTNFDPYKVLDPQEFEMRQAAEAGLQVLEKEDASDQWPLSLERAMLLFNTVATQLNHYAPKPCVQSPVNPARAVPAPISSSVSPASPVGHDPVPIAKLPSENTTKDRAGEQAHHTMHPAYSACMENPVVLQNVRDMACKDWRIRLHAPKENERRLPKFLKSVYPRIFEVS